MVRIRVNANTREHVSAANTRVDRVLLGLYGHRS